MNIRITEVISDITGVSGMKMIEAILNGERNRQTLMELCAPAIKNKKAELVLKALEGEYRQEHLFALRQAHQNMGALQNTHSRMRQRNGKAVGGYQ